MEGLKSIKTNLTSRERLLNVIESRARELKRDMKDTFINAVMLDLARLMEKHFYYYKLLPLLAEWGYNTLFLHLTDDHDDAHNDQDYLSRGPYFKATISK